MERVAVMDVSRLSPYSDGPDAPLWWGFMGMIAIESAVFGSLIASYFYLRAGAGVWPQGGGGPPELLLPTINTFVLLASSVPMHLADRSVTRGRTDRVAPMLLLAMLFAATFLVLKYVEYRDIPHPWEESAYGSIVWTIVGFHSAHVMALLLKTVVVTTLAARGYFDTQRRLGLTANGLYWHFVVIVWVPLYVVLYWVPRW